MRLDVLTALLLLFIFGLRLIRFSPQEIWIISASSADFATACLPIAFSISASRFCLPDSERRDTIRALQQVP